MAALVQRYRERHREFIEALDHLGEGGGRESELVQRMRLAMRKPLDEEQAEEAIRFWERIKESEADGQEFGRDLVGRLLRDGRGDSGLVKRIADSVGKGIDRQVAELPSAFGKWVSGFLTNINGILAFLLDLVLIPIYAFFLTLGMPKLRRSARAMVPRHGRERTMRILHAIERVVAAFFRGRLIVCAICSILVYAGFAPIGVPYAVLFALLIGLATTVPLLGLIFLVPALMLTAVEGGDHLTLRISLIVGVYTVVQTLEATVFTPTIMGREVELHPVLLILALLVFGNLLGILGLILAVPIAATLRILAREFLFPRLGIGEPVTSSISRRVPPP